MSRQTPSVHGEFLKTIRNHRELSSVLRGIAPSTDLSWFDGEATDICKYWLRLSAGHLRTAAKLNLEPGSWRGVISRCYYATYSASRSVRYFVKGFVQLDADDHKFVGDLPADFPDRLAWSNFVTELRRDRNAADYEPWPTARASLTFKPPEALSQAAAFLTTCRGYLRTKGLSN